MQVRRRVDKKLLTLFLRLRRADVVTHIAPPAPPAPPMPVSSKGHIASTSRRPG
jgi:hypothetical protein